MSVDISNTDTLVWFVNYIRFKLTGTLLKLVINTVVHQV